MFKQFSYLTLLLLSLNFISANEAPYPLLHISKQVHNIIRRGEAYIQPIPKTGESGRHFHGYILIDASIINVLNVLKDFQNYPEFMPHIINVDAIPTDKGINFRYFLQLPLGIEYQYETSVQIFSSPKKAWLTWNIAPWEGNNIINTWGQWLITPYKDSSLTLIQYQVFTDIGEIPYGFGWIVDLLTENSLPVVLINTKNWIETHAKP